MDRKQEERLNILLWSRISAEAKSWQDVDKCFLKHKYLWETMLKQTRKAPLLEILVELV